MPEVRVFGEERLITRRTAASGGFGSNDPDEGLLGNFAHHADFEDRRQLFAPGRSIARKRVYREATAIRQLDHVEPTVRTGLEKPGTCGEKRVWQTIRHA